MFVCVLISAHDLSFGRARGESSHLAGFCFFAGCFRSIVPGPPGLPPPPAGAKPFRPPARRWNRNAGRRSNRAR